jgi:hypothetical protein
VLKGKVRKLGSTDHKFPTVLSPFQKLRPTTHGSLQMVFNNGRSGVSENSNKVIHRNEKETERDS